MDRLLIVDGNNLLFQMFFGMPSRIVNSKGKAIQGTLGFVGALLKIIRRVDPHFVAVLFDGEHGTERQSLDPDYKANRPQYGPEEETPFSQLEDVYAALDLLGVKHAETVTCETDDWIAGYALRYGAEMEVVISSFDSDFFQLINENVSVLRYRGENTLIWTADTVKEKFGVAPCQYADLKSLTGDPSDNIKGAPKIGPKTAAELLNGFGTLEGIIENSNNIRKPSVRASVKENEERLRKNYRLIKLKGEESLPFSLDELTYADSHLTTRDVLKGIDLA